MSSSIKDQLGFNLEPHHFCTAMKQWRVAIIEQHIDDPEWQGRIDALAIVFLMISKSDLLDRLIYGEEELRTKKCPQHKGIWSGLEMPDTVCPHGCQLTGWLPDNA